MPQPARSELPAVTLGDWIYVPGGFGGENRLERYHPQSDRWEALTGMPDGRHHLMATAYNNFLYVFGGAHTQSWIPSDTVWRYNPTENQWSELERMPESRSAGVAVTLDNAIYIVGGVGGSEDMLAFSPEDGTWQLVPGPNQPREHVSAVTYQGEIWVLGGRWSGVGELSTVEIYNPTVNTWRNGPALNVARAGFTAAVVGENIVAAGGEVVFNGIETLDSVEIFAPDSTTWQFGPKLPIAIHGVGGAAFEQNFLLLGGSVRAGAIENEGLVQIYAP